MLHAIIMAGGPRTRNWPVSTKDRPKQLQALVGESSLLAATVARVRDLVPPARCMVVTNARLVDAVRAELPDLPAESVVGEPAKRDTAPCIGLAALLTLKSDPQATMLVMPSDHVIAPIDPFQAALQQAAEMVEHAPGRLVTFGIKPSYPAESFGYIHRGEPMPESHPAPAYRVKQFREKPDAATAADYLASGEYYWNSGIFVWKSQTILDALAQRQPTMLRHLQKIAAAWDGSDAQNVVQREFTAIEGTSIDYAVMEHANDVAVIEAPFQWDDLGSWQSLARLVGEDAAGNTTVGRHLGIDTTGSIVRTSDDHVVVTLGVRDLIVVHTPQATLVARKQDEERIREVVQELQVRQWDDVL